MPMDGLTLTFMTRELQALLVGGRVDKVAQPDSDAVVLTVRSQGGNHKLLLCCNANRARIQLTELPFENPAEPPMFCMLLRKHLTGAHITAVEQLFGDRILQIDMDTLGEMNDRVRRTLYLELMGRHSNLTLCDEDGRIIDCIKHVNSEMSRVRTLLPGGTYQLPPAQDKLHGDSLTAEALAARLSAATGTLAKALAENVSGLATICAKEICAQLGVLSDTPVRELDASATANRLYALLLALPQMAAPVLLEDESGQSLDFFAFPYKSYPAELQKRRESLSLAMDDYELGHELQQRMRQRAGGLQHTVKTALERLEKKRELLRDTLSQSEQAEQNRVYGKLLTANLHLLQRGQESVTLTNYYLPDAPEVAIALSGQSTPAQNAQSYFKKYRKQKSAQQYAAEQLALADTEIEFLEGALEDIDKCTSAADLAEVRFTLTERGYARPDPAQRKRKKLPEGKPYRFAAADGASIDVGKNSLQNDRLTLHARPDETWLHAQGIPGSHVIIRCDGKPSDGTLLQAAKLAAYFSKGRNHPAQPVDCTLRRYVKKAAGSPAGFVTYTNFSTILVGLTREDMIAIAKEANQCR